MKKIYLIFILLLSWINTFTQVIDWASETGLSLGSTFVDGQVITDFASSGIDVTINVNIVSGYPSINASDGTIVDINNADDASFTLTVSGGVEMDLILNNSGNLQEGEKIILSNPNSEPITITETGSNGVDRMEVDGVLMTGALPSVIIGVDSIIIRESDDGAGTDWNASLNSVISFTWKYEVASGTSDNEGFKMNLLNTTLPIELVAFSAMYDEFYEGIDITWITKSETNNDYFVIEKSPNGIEWSEIQIIDGAGNSLSTLNYQYFDPNLQYGVYYYRLKQVDFDGKYSYSQVKSVYVDQLTEMLSYPNPVNFGEKVTLLFRGETKGMYNIQIVDFMGRTISNNTFEYKQGLNELEIISNNFEKGVYYILVRDPQEGRLNRTIKIVVV
ncbi:MAG: hypothetical protein ACI8ZM_002962 [Crocinitomix sp.]|jgi:hypothetical protein